jgi:hypothetical protein
MKRYNTKDAEYQIYTDNFIRYKMQSNILNSGDMPGMDTIFFDRENIKSELLTRVGDENGKYLRGKRESTAFIPYLEIQLEAIEQKWKDYQKRKLNSGYPKPTEWPKELLNEKLKFQARLDVTQSEVDALTKKLKEFKDVEEQKTDNNVLEYGCIGHGHFHGTRAADPDLINTLKEIDGQTISQTGDGLLIINDSRSIYFGLSVADYRGKVCKQFINEQRQRDREKLKKLQLKAREEGLPLPKQLVARGPVKISKSSLPPWPEGCRNYLTDPEEERSSSYTPRRTKK